MKQKTLSVSEFKAKALGLFEEIDSGDLEIVVTKRGRPIASVGRVKGLEAKRGPNRLAHTVVEEDDIVSPLGPDLWGALK